jgi:hypothetical protein
MIHILGLNEHERVWARQVCKAARDAFAATAAVPATNPMPLWAFQWMWQNRTSPEQHNRVAAGRAAAADLPALTWLKSSSTRSSSACNDAAQLFTPAVCAAAAGAGHVHVLQWLRYAADNLLHAFIRHELSSNHSARPLDEHTYAAATCTRVCSELASAQHLVCQHCTSYHDEVCQQQWHSTGRVLGNDSPCAVQYWHLYSSRVKGCCSPAAACRTLRPPCPWDFTTCTAAARTPGNLHTLVWLRQQQPRCPWAGTEVRNTAE